MGRSKVPQRGRNQARLTTSNVPRTRIRARTALVCAGVLVVGLSVLYAIDRLSGPAHVGREAARILASLESPTRGPANAKVHIVEFLDPVCGACAHFYPVVEQVIDENPQKIRLSIRHVAFHEGSEFAIRVLEASRKQGKYWELLDALLSTQGYWAADHRPRPERILRVTSLVDLDDERLERDLRESTVTERIAQDRLAARALKVSATPKFFVNGRAPAGRREAQLLRLISQELREAY
jgi:protein-disulfide isomerase